MSDTVSYNAGKAGAVTLSQPTITVSHNTVISQYRKFTVLVRISYTVRAFLFAVNSASLEVAMEECRTVLSVSGGDFSANYGNNADFLKASPDADVAGGPHPTYLNITKVWGSKAAAVVWQLTTEKHVKDDNVSRAGAWLDFLYSTVTSLDENFYATRVTSGILRLSSCHQWTKDHSADAFRDTVESNIAPLPTVGTWQRVSREFRLSRDHKVLAFTITDQQLYTPLPNAITAGDFSITTIAARGGNSKYVLRGWFESSPSISRVHVQTAVKRIWELFFHNVWKVIEQETKGHVGEFTLANERRMYTCHWRSNRVEFEASYEVFGTFDQQIPDNVEYLVNRAVNFLTLLSRTHYKPIMDEGSGGSAPILGPKGTEAPARVIVIDPMEKLPKGFLLGAGVTGTIKPGPTTTEKAGTSRESFYTTYHQHYEYRYDPGLVCIPVKQNDAVPIIQQTKNKELTLIITGEAESVGREPELPPAIHTTYAQGVEGTITSGAPTIIRVKSAITSREPSPEGIYRLSWKQVYKFYNIGPHIPLMWPSTPLNQELGGKAVTWSNTHAETKLLT